MIVNITYRRHKVHTQDKQRACNLWRISVLYCVPNYSSVLLILIEQKLQPLQKTVQFHGNVALHSSKFEKGNGENVLERN